VRFRGDLLEVENPTRRKPSTLRDLVQEKGANNVFCWYLRVCVLHGCML